ncbi:biotin--[acetyl-CoA-carboxylase] ligase [Roseobacter sp. YSTF-M11]|uniref:biotin--[biotin carboxyl-carrier protein] ligase n=1 Tax=Roseobacter insulae TaxID=2859783 RepID=A0A9X1JY81_9RHOB|nr:biotin--[acetyl-CoA-carboxylase] ligase [Roseobacter insulae]MBW4707926.1 biotin--[acetyl-CoA-carboxylase] ligase [Roseobacter insulae]
MTRWPEGYGRFVLDSVGSTLDEAARMAPGTPGAFWVFAHAQTAARGRRGRPWSMYDGNFAATLLLHPEETPGVAALRSFVMSLALYRSFVEVTGNPDDFTLKWPNDVLLRSGKVAGILLESAGQGGKMGPLAIGVGVNLVHAPGAEDVEPGAVRPVSLMGEAGCKVAAEAFLTVLAHHYAALESQFVTFGFAPIRTAWLAHAARLGQPVIARTGREDISGTFEDIDGDGNLMLRTSRGVRSIAAADVFFQTS